MRSLFARPWLVLAFSAAVFAGGALAQTGAGSGNGPVVLYGIGPDRRDHVNVDEMPWRAEGKLEAASGNLVTVCTGTLIGPSTVLTAAHCFYSERLSAYLPAAAFHFLLGFDRGHYAAAATGVSITVGPGYDPKNGNKTRGSDWAVLRLDTKLGASDRMLALSEEPPRIGTPVAIGGYSRDYVYALTADSHCRIIGRSADGNGRVLLEHDCTAKQGASGSPVLVQDALGWTIHGVDVLTGRDNTRGMASIPTGVKD